MESKGKLAEKYSVTRLTKTGGGCSNVQMPTPEEQRMLSIIGTDSVIGIAGGIDSSIGSKELADAADIMSGTKKSALQLIDKPQVPKLVQNASQLLCPDSNTSKSTPGKSPYKLTSHELLGGIWDNDVLIISPFKFSQESNVKEKQNIAPRKPKNVTEKLLAAQDNLCNEMAKVTRIFENSVKSQMEFQRDMISVMDRIYEVEAEKLKTMKASISK